MNSAMIRSASIQDVGDTAQGNWFDSSLPLGPTPTSSHLALVHDKVDPTIAALVWVPSPQGTWMFTPEHTGTVNREFSEITSDGNVYCYEGLMDDGVSPLAGRFLLELTSPTELRIEHDNATCAEEREFGTPLLYRR